MAELDLLRFHQPHISLFLLTTPSPQVLNRDCRLIGTCSKVSFASVYVRIVSESGLLMYRFSKILLLIHRYSQRNVAWTIAKQEVPTGMVHTSYTLPNHNAEPHDQLCGNRAKIWLSACLRLNPFAFVYFLSSLIHMSMDESFENILIASKKGEPTSLR